MEPWSPTVCRTCVAGVCNCPCVKRFIMVFWGTLWACRPFPLLPCRGDFLLCCVVSRVALPTLLCLVFENFVEPCSPRRFLRSFFGPLPAPLRNPAIWVRSLLFILPLDVSCATLGQYWLWAVVPNLCGVLFGLSCVRSGVVCFAWCADISLRLCMGFSACWLSLC